MSERTESARFFLPAFEGLDSKMKPPTPTKRSAFFIAAKESWGTKNPFEEFKTFTPPTPDGEFPLDQIVQSTEAVMDRIRSGYEKLLEEEAK